MRSALHDGTQVSVQKAAGDRYVLPALRLSDISSYQFVTERLLAAMADRLGVVGSVGASLEGLLADRRARLVESLG